MRLTARHLCMAAWVLVVGMALAGGEEIADTEALKRAGDVKDEIQKTLQIRLTTQESKNFLIHSNTPAEERKKALKAAEAVYDNLSGIFRIKKGQRVWPGKFAIVIFKNQQEFTDYWYKVCKRQGQPIAPLATGFNRGLEGYVGHSTPGHLSDLTGSFYFHLSPRFLKKYGTGKETPPWVEMGFMKYCSYVLASDGDGTNRRRHSVKDAIARGDRRSFQVMRETKSWPSSDPRGRDLCFSLVDYMISISQNKFVEFVDKVKEGAPDTEALKEAFGVTAEEFEKGWLGYIERQY